METSIFKEASRQGLRVVTSKGPLSVEQLWSLSTEDLSTTIKHLSKSLKKNQDSEDLSFLDQTTEVKTDSKVQLAFDILKEIYLTKKSEQEAQNKAAENKIYNQKIFQFLASKRESDLQKELEGKSEEEILSMIK